MGALAFDAGLFVWSLVTFGVLFLVLARYVFKPLRKVLDDRERAIQESIRRAEQAQEEGRRALARNEEVLASARDEARKIVDEGHRISAAMQKEGRETAKTEADQLVERAREEIDREVRRNLDELKSVVANLSVRVAQQVIEEGLDEKRHEQLADNFIERLKNTPPRG
jgi:F-type H+-transporting ATPase subunit b